MNPGIVMAAVFLVGMLVFHLSTRRREKITIERDLASLVNGPLGADQRRLADAGALVERARQAGLSTRLHISGQSRDLPRRVDNAAYRIVQEALTNALELGTKTATVIIGYQPSTVTITVYSPVGSHPARHSGLKRMRERATPVGGTVQAGPHGAGWRVHAELPTELNPT